MPYASIEKQREAQRRWKEKNREKVRLYDKAYRERKPEVARARKRRWRLENKEHDLKKGREYSRLQRARHPDKVRKAKQRDRERPLVKLRYLISNRILIALKRNYKSGRTLELLGCSILECRQHLEKQFKPGMTWENRGQHGWHIDHKRPCASFDLTDPKQQKQCFHYTNLQPLWAKDNLSKGDKILA